MTDSSSDKKYPSGKLILPSLVLSRGATQPPLVVLGLLLIEIGRTFDSPVGVTSQISTFKAIIAIIFALLMGILSVRFKHKSLLVMGLLIYTVASFLCSLSPSFIGILLAYSLTGIGSATVDPMANALVGNLIPMDKRSRAIGMIFAGMALSYLISAPMVGFIGGIWGWRMAFLGFVMPFSMISLVTAYFGVPSESENFTQVKSTEDYFSGFKKVFSNKSAFACLLGSALTEVSWVTALTFSISFFRESFQVPTSLASLLLSGMAFMCAVGSVSSGFLVNKFGRKTIAVVSSGLLGVFSIVYVNFPLLWLSVAAMYLNCVITGIRYASLAGLTLEQLPGYRGSLMSLNSASQNMGAAFGTFIGGIALLTYGYGIQGILTGVMAILAAIVIYRFVVDPINSTSHV